MTCPRCCFNEAAQIYKGVNICQECYDKLLEEEKVIKEFNIGSEGEIKINNILNKKIELLPKTPKENEILCPTCSGIGWLEDGCGHIVTCNNHQCNHGIIKCCPECGTPYKHYYSNYCENKECVKKERIKRQQDEVEREQNRFKNAKKIKYDEAPDEIKEMVYSDYCDYNEGYDSNLDWIDDLEDNEKPEYVWATSKVKIVIDAEDILENACDELHEDAYAQLDDIDELQDFLNHWCDKQAGTDTYYTDYNIALLL